MTRGKIAVVTMGCKVNQFESEAIAEAMTERGWELASFGPGVDCTIINTCIVTERAEADSRRWIYRAKRVNPDGLLLAVGCYPQIDPQGVLRLGPDGVTGNQEKGSIPDIVEEMHLASSPVIRVGDIMGAANPAALQVTCFRHHTRAFLKIQDGCDARCSYCIVPSARGRSRSVPPSHVMVSLQRLSAAGYREVVLVGIHLGTYGLDLAPTTTLMELLRRIEGGETPPRIRLSSLEPQETSAGMIDFISSSQKVCPHFHLPLQNGADEILRRMNRPYTERFFHDLVLYISEKVPQAAIGADVMVGFPGEDEKAFQRTYDLLSGLPISYLHVFPFSPRPGTEAAGMPQQVATLVKKERAKVLRDLGWEKKRAFYSRFSNKPVSLLIEHRRERGMLRGLSRNYIVCLLEGGDDFMGREVEVMLQGVHGGRGVGRMVSEQGRGDSTALWW